MLAARITKHTQTSVLTLSIWQAGQLGSLHGTHVDRPCLLAATDLHISQPPLSSSLQTLSPTQCRQIDTQTKVRRLIGFTLGVTSSTLKTSRPDQILCSALRFGPGQPGYRRRLRTVNNRGRRGSLTLLFDRRRNSVGHFDAVAFLLLHLLSNGPLHRTEITYLNWYVKDSYWTLSRIKYRLKSLVSASLSHFSS